MIPAINDAEIERILDAAVAAGAREAGYVLLRLPLEVRDLFREWLMANFPDRYRHVFKLIRDTRGGKDYDAKWGERMTGTGPIAYSNLGVGLLGLALLNVSGHASYADLVRSRMAAGAPGDHPQA